MTDERGGRRRRADGKTSTPTPPAKKSPRPSPPTGHTTPSTRQATPSTSKASPSTVKTTPSKRPASGKTTSSDKAAASKRRASGSAKRPAQSSAKLHARIASPSSSADAPHALPPTRYHFFGGKGGVGKTTAASAAALLMLEQADASERILLFSTDPAHSLGDSLDFEIGDTLTEVVRRDDGAALFAREMDAAGALEAFKQKHHATLAEIADRGTLLDETDIDELLGLSLPGMDEVMSLFELSEIDLAGNFARIVVDTAPSGHTSRMLRLPEVFSRWLGALDRMSAKHRYMMAQFARGRRGREDAVDTFLRELSERVARVRAMLYEAERATFTLVAIPEAMSVEETARYFALLQKERVPVRSLIINRVERAHAGCPFCRARAAGQSRWLKRLAREFASLQIRHVPLLDGDVRGLDALRRFAHLAWTDAETDSDGDDQIAPPATEKSEHRASSKTVARHGGRAARADIDVAARAKSDEDAGGRFSLESRRLLIFGGKGGVGKTTAAAAAALALAEGDTQARVLVFSTDPAHSLSDSFDESIGDLKQGVAGVKNLDAMEIDPAARFEQLKERYRAWTDELFESLTGGSRWQVQFDREAMRELVSLAPPGIDEIAALSAISDLLEDRSYTTIVLDTAPTGHLVRFLEMPEIALAWVRTFIKLLLKYKDVVGRWSGVAEELITLSKSIKRVAALLTDRAACEFVGVSIAEPMSLEETVRLSATLERLKVPMSRLLVNNVVTTQAAARCDFCAARRRAQQRALEDFRRSFPQVENFFLAPQQPHEINGAAHLREHFSNWQLEEKKAVKGRRGKGAKG